MRNRVCRVHSQSPAELVRLHNQRIASLGRLCISRTYVPHASACGRGCRSAPVRVAGRTLELEGMTETRVHLSRSEPEAYKTLEAFTKAVHGIAKANGIDARLKEFVMLHVSQLNGCAFCVRIHVDRALTAGVTVDEIGQLAAWRDSGVFSDRERAGAGARGGVHLHPPRRHPRRRLQPRRRRAEREGVRRPELDLRVHQRLQPRRHRGPISGARRGRSHDAATRSAR